MYEEEVIARASKNLKATIELVVDELIEKPFFPEDFLEQRLFALALLPYKYPNVSKELSFISLGDKNGRIDGLPTIAGALELLGDTEDIRKEVLHRLSPNGNLVRKKMISFSEVENHIPFTNKIMYVSHNLAFELLSGKSFEPQFPPSFPAKKVETELEWDDLILEPHILKAIEEIKQWIAQSNAIMEDENFKKRINPGYRALFYGPSGTGKTLAATLLGKYTGKDVYRIDLSMVVSKYIGETEKNLSNVFKTAEHKNWILFFDEADSLFGKRTGVKSSNDRYANQEVSYLLQRIENYNGLVILASNLKNNLDNAFTRRFQSIIHFRTPGPKERLRIWQETFQGADLHEEIDMKAIADKYEMTGGTIANVLRTSLIHSKSRGDSITQQDLLQGIKKEYTKEGRVM